MFLATTAIDLLQGPRGPPPEPRKDLKLKTEECDSALFKFNGNST